MQNIFVPSTFDSLLMCEINPQWYNQNAISTKFPKSHEDNFIDFVGYDFVGRIRRIYSDGIVHSYIADDSDSNTFIEIIVQSPYYKPTGKIISSNLIITYITGNQCEYGSLYSIGDKVQYELGYGLTHAE